MADPSPKKNLNLVYGMGVNVTGSVFGRTAHFLSQLLAARTLGPFAFGIYAIGWNYLRTMGVIATLSLDSGVIHYGTQFRKNSREKMSEVISGSLMITCASGLLLGLLTYSFSSQISWLINKPGLEVPLRWFGLALPLLAGTKVAASATRISLKMVAANFVEEFVQPVMNLILIGLLLVLNGGLSLYALAALVSFGGSFAAALVYLRREFLEKGSQLGSMLSAGWEVLVYSIPISVPVLLGTVMLMMDRLFVGYFLSEEAAGIYQTIALTSAVFISLLSAVKTIVAPMSADYFHQHQLEELEALVQTSTRWVLNLCFPVILVILVSPEIFLEVVFGESYRAGGLVLVIIILGQLLNLSKGAVDQVLVMTNHQKSWMGVTTLVFILSAALFLIFIPRLGILGAAVGNFLLYSGLFLGAGILLETRLKIRMLGSSIIKSFAAAGITLAMMLLTQRAFALPDIWMLIVQFAGSCTLFLVLLYLMGLSEADKQTIRDIRRQMQMRMRGPGGEK